MGDGPPRVVWHTTESGTGDAAFRAVAAYLRSKGSEPHLLWDPISGRVGQYFPATVSGRALANWGGVRTNRTGRVTIQIEVLGRAKDAPLKNGPCEGLERILAWLDSWGIPRTWPGGNPKPSPDCYGLNNGDRSSSIWLNKGGQFAHSQVPGNTHSDPGLIDPRKWVKKVEHMATVWKIGESKLVKTDEAVPIVGGKWTTLTQITLPKGARYLVTLQVRMPRGVAGGEAQLGRIGWGTPGQAIDSTGHNPIPPASFELRWRTPIHHEMAGGGPVAFMIWLPAASKPHEMRYVAKATRFA